VRVKQPIPRYPKISKIIPTELDVWMDFHDQILLVGNGLGGIAKQFNPNCPYDVDPSLGSTSTPGFVEMASLFGFVRVLRYRYKVQFLNKEAINVTCIVVNSNSNPGTGNLLSLVGNEYVKTSSIGPMLSGKGTCVLKGTVDVSQLVGSLSVETDDSYASTTAAVPRIRFGFLCQTITLGERELRRERQSLLILVCFVVSMSESSKHLNHHYPSQREVAYNVLTCIDSFLDARDSLKGGSQMK